MKRKQEHPYLVKITRGDNRIPVAWLIKKNSRGEAVIIDSLESFF